MNKLEILECELTNDLWNDYDNNSKKDVIDKKHDIDKYVLLAFITNLLNSSNSKNLKSMTVIKNKVNDIFKSQFTLEKEYLLNTLRDVIKDSYDIQRFIYYLGYGNISDSISKKDIEKIINEKIEDKTNIDRIRDNKDNIADKIIKNIGLYLTGVLTIEQIKKKIEAIFKENKDNTIRMFDNETHRCTNKAYNQFYKDYGVKKVQYISRLEHNTCNECRQLNGKIFNVGTEIELPKHVHCMCFYIPYYPKWNTDLNINYNNFKKWSDK